jgi:hypothetical protein
MTGTEPHAWETGLMDNITYVGLDVHKGTVCVALAEGGRGGEVRQIGVFENRPEILIKLATRLSKGRRPAELLLRGRALRLWAASVIDRWWT